MRGCGWKCISSRGEVKYGIAGIGIVKSIWRVV